MNEEKKTYSVIGRVEIGTDEYRDLIEGLAMEKKRADDNDHQRWEEYRRANKAENELNELKKKVKEYEEFICSDEGIKAQLKLFRIEKAEEEK